MKSFRYFFAAVAASLVILFASADVNSAPPAEKSISSILSSVPSNLVVKQTATLNDGRAVTIYYRKTGDYCEIYSPDNLNGYSQSDLLKLDSTSFSLVSEVKGERLYRCTVSKARSIVKSLVNKYL